MTVRPTKYDGAEVDSLLRANQEDSARLGVKPWLRAKAIFVTLVSGVATVQHGLKRKPAGWMFHTILGPSHVFVATAPDAAAIQITANSVGSCMLEVW